MVVPLVVVSDCIRRLLLLCCYIWVIVGLHISNGLLYIGLALVEEIPGFPTLMGVDPMELIQSTIFSTLRMYMDVRRKEYVFLILFNIYLGSRYPC